MLPSFLEETATTSSMLMNDDPMTTKLMPSWTASRTDQTSEDAYRRRVQISLPASILFASSTPRSVNTFERSLPSIGSLRGIPPVARMRVSYETLPDSPITTSFETALMDVTSVLRRRSTPKLDRSSVGERHSSLEGSVTSALLSLVL